MEQQKEQFRHELKYLVSDAQLAMLRNRVNHLLMPDAHAAPGGVYTVRSLYFDDYKNSCYYENENGTDPREKFRIRIYNGSTERIMLECKRKEHGKTRKTSCLLTMGETTQLMEGKPLTDIRHQPQPLRKLSLQMLMYHLRPVLIVEYDRIPYVYSNGNVRVTLDTNVATSSAVGSFLNPQIPKRPVMFTGQQLLEVKYDAYLPDFIYQNLQLQNLRQTAFSKYYICRKFAR